jgi:hypothetical protein
MRKGLLLCLALMMSLSVAAWAINAKVNTPLNYSKDGETTTRVSSARGTVPPFATKIAATGYADAWRSTSSPCGPSLWVSPDGQTIATVFGVANGTNCDVNFGYSVDGGGNWSFSVIDANLNTRIYNGIRVANVDGNYIPLIAWQDRGINRIKLRYDEGGIGGDSWTPIQNISSDSVAWYIPSIGLSAQNRLFISAFAHGAAAPAGDFSNHYSATDDNGATMLVDWQKLCHNEISGIGNAQDGVDWIFSPSGDTVIAFEDAVLDTAWGNALGGYGFGLNVKISIDGGMTFGAMQTAMGYIPQYEAGTWWYRYDGTWCGDRPHLTAGCFGAYYTDMALFDVYPTNAGDFTNWTVKRISDIPGTGANVYPGDMAGQEPDFSTLVTDGSGNLFAIYLDYRKIYPGDFDPATQLQKKEIFGVASTNGGASWLTPVMLTDDTSWTISGNIFVEAYEKVANGKIHLVLHDANYANIYYWNTPAATLLAAPARPSEISLAPVLRDVYGKGVGGPVDAQLDTVASDTILYLWSPSVALGQNYEMTISKSANWASGADNYDLNLTNPYNFAQVVGLPSAGVWYYKVRASLGAQKSPWSQVFDFEYTGAAINTTDWVTPSGIEGKPTDGNRSFALNQNRPNPVNGNTSISFSLPKAGEYSLKIYNVAGQVVSNINGRGQVGINNVSWNSRNTSNGVYFYQLNAAGKTATRKMVVIK